MDQFGSPLPARQNSDGWRHLLVPSLALGERRRIGTPVPDLNTAFSIATIDAVIIYVAIVFQHFQLASPLAYPLTLGAVAGAILVLRLTAHFDWRVAGAVLPSIGLISGVAALLDTDRTELLDYSRTLALVLATAVFVMAGLSYRVSSPIRNRIRLQQPLKAALYTITALCCVQVATGLGGNDFFFNPFRSRQYLYEYDPWLTAGAIPRAAGFFLEPSYAALVISFLVALILRLEGGSAPVLVASGAGMLATQSATGLVAFGAILLVWGLGGRGLSMWSSLIVCLIVLGVAGSYVVTRLSSIEDSSSSAYYRFVAPLPLIGDVLSTHPLGRSLGSVALGTSQANLQNGLEAGQTIDNGLILMIYYFGIVGVILCSVAVIAIGGQLVVSLLAKDGRAPVLTWLAFAPMFNGGIFLPEFAMMLWLTIPLLRLQTGKAFEHG